jgi:hypothetical protein
MNTLISGTPYSLQEIFSGDNDKVIIPDLQRDYCWGNPYSNDSNDSLVSSFLDSILNLDRDKDITMGLIYGYYDRLKPYHLQLCDGQQRLTTLFLIIGIINRYTNNRYQDILISNFELNEDDGEPHLMYGIRESSLYFLSDLTTHYFLDTKLKYSDIDSQYWFLNSYKHDPTILCILKALKTIEERLNNCLDMKELGDFIVEHLKFLFYDMANRQNGEETFVVINTTGEPLSANQNLKPVIILKNQGYCRTEQLTDGSFVEHNTAQDWEEMETWFWQKRHLNDIDTSTEGMLAFLHCVRVLECQTEAEWHHTIDINNEKFPTSIPMTDIWKWFCAYRRMYELNYSRLSSSNISYPDKQPHYTQKDLYSILPTMVYCRMNQDATGTEIQRIYHLFNNMGRYRQVTRSSQNESIYVPAYRVCQWVKALPTKDILSFLDLSTFEVEEEKTKLTFLSEFKNNESVRRHIEEIFAKAENFRIFDGQIATMVKWSELSLDKLEFFYSRIQELWIAPDSLNKLRRALLAWGVKGYPMSTGTANKTLCSNTEWRVLFEKRDEQIKSFICNGQLDDIIANHQDENSPFYLLIHNEKYLDFSKDHNIRIHPQGVIELMAKTYASANFLLFHNGVVFEKEMVDMQNWNGFWVWSDGESSVFYSTCLRLNITLDMWIAENGYQIVGWCNRRPDKPSVSSDVLTEIGFVSKEDAWYYPIITSPYEAKTEFIEITKRIVSNP